MSESKLMLAFHGKQEIKNAYMKRVAEHKTADEIVQGYGYWEDGKGCAVGCTIHGRDHAAYEIELGIPKAIAFLEDRFFEGMPQAKAREWPCRFLSAIPVGADLSLVVPRFIVWLLSDKKHGVIRFAGDNTQVKKSIKTVSDLYRRLIDGGRVADYEWNETAAEAAEAAEAAARAAEAAEAAARAAEAAGAAAWAAAEAARAAARAAAGAAGAAAWAAGAAARAAEAAAWVASYERMADKLIELLEAAPIKNGGKQNGR